MKLKKELPLLIIVLLPFVYLAFIWNALPEKVPLHWDINGNIDRWGSKIEIIYIPVFLGLLTYLIFLLVPLIDPKNRIKLMGNKYQNLKFLMVTFMSALSLFIIYSTKEQKLFNSGFIIFFFGLLFALLGNYFKTIKPNYFIGIRTPWTLENEQVWKDTHRLGGKMWLTGGLLIIFFGIVLPVKSAFTLMLIITAIISLVPIIYSYVVYKNLNKKTG